MNVMLAATVEIVMDKIMKKQDEKDKKMRKVMEKVLEVLEDIADKDCYDRISAASMPRKLDKVDYAKAYGVPIPDLQCMVTGISLNSLIATSPGGPTPPNPVTLAHLLARCADAKESMSLGYGLDDIENMRNTILLCKFIEVAFDHKLISFVPMDKPFSGDRYKLHIWVDAIRPHPIFPGAAQTIGSLDGAPLNLSVGGTAHNPFHRALSFQAFRAFKMWGKDFGLTELPEDCDTSVYQGTYKTTRAKYAQQLAKDIAADDDDEDV